MATPLSLTSESKERAPFLARWEVRNVLPVGSRDIGSDDTGSYNKSTDSRIVSVVRRLPPWISVVRLNVDEFPVRTGLTIEIRGTETAVSLRLGDKSYDISKPSVAWFRRLGAPGVDAAVPDRYRPFVLAEAEHQLAGAMSLVAPGHWINPFWETRRAATKPLQLREAAAAGLQTPDTLSTNDMDSLSSWMPKFRDVIAKSLHSPMISGQRVGEGATFAFTGLLSEIDKDDLTDVAIAPTQYQPFIEKAFEVRVTTIGDQHFSVRIDTDEEGTTDLDWRDQKSSYSPIEVPQETLEKLSTFLARLGLQYAATDFIVRPDGSYVFLESNPHGAWLWLENSVADLTISEAIATHIASKVVK